jgi:hypothetical protein
MTTREIGATELHRQAYEIAWREFSALCNLMTPDEKRTGPDRLRWYIEIMVDTGERDASKIARACIGMLREYEQISRSKARLINENLTQP